MSAFNFKIIIRNILRMEKIHAEYMIIFIIGLSLTCLILALVKFSKLCVQFSKFTKNAKDNFDDIQEDIKKMQLSSREMIIEKRRNNKLVEELLDAQKNYNPLDGLEYELVEN